PPATSATPSEAAGAAERPRPAVRVDDGLVDGACPPGGPPARRPGLVGRDPPRRTGPAAPPGAPGAPGPRRPPPPGGPPAPRPGWGGGDPPRGTGPAAPAGVPVAQCARRPLPDRPAFVRVQQVGVLTGRAVEVLAPEAQAQLASEHPRAVAEPGRVG